MEQIFEILIRIGFDILINMHFQNIQRDGTISEKEFTKGIDHIRGMKGVVTMHEAVFAAMDEDGSGSIDLKEFALWLGRTKMRKEEGPR